jgi:RNA polymerase sigma factor (sigma-70 family)
MPKTTVPQDATAAPLLSVTDLLRRANDGDQAAWEEIVRRYRGLVIAKVRSFQLQEADAHDAAQMTWLRLAENCHRIQFPEHLGGWLATTASRECLHILRHATHSPDRTDTAAENVADLSVGPEQHVINMDTARTLRNLVAELPPRKRILLRALFADKPTPYAELARTTGIPPGSIGPTRARTLRQLRRKLDEHQLGQAV